MTKMESPLGGGKQPWPSSVIPGRGCDPVGAWTGDHAKVQESSAYCSAAFVALGG